MKKVLTILLAGVSTLAFAQKKIDLSRSIDDDGKTLSISVHGTVDGKRIDYNRTFQVADLSKEKRNEIVDSVLDSLGLDKIKAPSPPSSPQAPHEPRAPKSPTHFSAGKSDNDAPVMVWVEEEHEDAVPAENSKPYDKKVKYNSESGELYLRYQFMKNGEEFIYEKTVNVADKTEKQRQNIIKSFEKEIELPGSLIQ